MKGFARNLKTSNPPSKVNCEEATPFYYGIWSNCFDFRDGLAQTVLLL